MTSNEDNGVMDKKRRRKIGRTLVLKSEMNDNNLVGLINSINSPTGSKFMVFDTVDNAKNAFRKLIQEKHLVKPSYYKLFFKISDMKNLSYDELKDKIKNAMNAIDNTMNVLYFKLYRKGDILTGSGDLVLDRKDHMDRLIDMRSFPIGDSVVNVYRYIVARR